MDETLDPKADVKTIHADIDPFDEELDNAGLLGREEFVPDSVEVDEGRADFCLSDILHLLPRRAPCCDYDFRRAEEDAELVDDGSLDFGGGTRLIGESSAPPLMTV